MHFPHENSSNPITQISDFSLVNGTSSTQRNCNLRVQFHLKDVQVHIAHIFKSMNNK